LAPGNNPGAFSEMEIFPEKASEPAELWQNNPILQTEARPKRRMEVVRVLCTVAH